MEGRRMADEFATLAQEEIGIAGVDLKQRSPGEAVIRFYSRHDTRLAAAIGSARTKPACRAGCWYCCYYKVVAKPVEVFAIVDYVKQKYSTSELQRALAEAEKNVAEVKGMSDQEHLATNQKCPVLVEQKCSIYPVRPSKCRNFHSSDVERCRESYEKPTDLSIPDSYVEEVRLAGNASSAGFGHAVELKGLDSRPYDLNAAFVEAMENPKCAKRYKNGKKAFLRAKFNDVNEIPPSNRGVRPTRASGHG
jgi:Fe-S-cluster containining protein